VVAFRQGLKEAGFIEGQNVVIEYRSAEDQARWLPALIADLVRQQLALIVGAGAASAVAAKSAAKMVPIVFVTGGDPVMQGLVASLNRPGGNTTGVSFLTSASDRNSSLSKPAAIAKLSRPLRRSPNVGLVRCTWVLARSCTPVGNGSLR
jgi:ABC-type uncharacterized transport system substrate-binding protein